MFPTIGIQAEGKKGSKFGNKEKPKQLYGPG